MVGPYSVSSLYSEHWEMIKLDSIFCDPEGQAHERGATICGATISRIATCDHSPCIDQAILGLMGKRVIGCCRFDCGGWSAVMALWVTVLRLFSVVRLL